MPFLAYLWCNGIEIIIHEFGHTAGLGHTWFPGSVMVEGQSINDQRLSLSWIDKWELRGLY